MNSSPSSFPEVIIIIGTGTARGQKNGTVMAGAWHVILFRLSTKTVDSPLDGVLPSGRRFVLGLEAIVAALESFDRRTTWSLIADESFERFWAEHVKRWKRLLYKKQVIHPEEANGNRPLWERAIAVFQKHWFMELPSEFLSVRADYQKPAIQIAKANAIEYRNQIMALRSAARQEDDKRETLGVCLFEVVSRVWRFFYTRACFLGKEIARLWGGRTFELVIPKPKPEEDFRLGVRGERYAAWMLSEKGYRILTMNWHGKRYELDIVAQDGKTLVFVEVKTRTDMNYNDPERNVAWEKQHRICEVAQEFLQTFFRNSPPIRFDTIGIVWSNERLPDPDWTRHRVDAFPMITTIRSR